MDDLETLQQQLQQAQHTAVRLALEKKTEEAIAYTIKEFRPRSLALIEKAKRFYEQQAKLLEKGRIELTEKVDSYTLTLILAALFAIIVRLNDRNPSQPRYYSRTAGKYRSTVVVFSRNSRHHHTGRIERSRDRGGSKRDNRYRGGGETNRAARKPESEVRFRQRAESFECIPGGTQVG